MREYASDAVVLEAMPNGNLDGRIVFFTERFGKMTAKAKSMRKVTSKLAGHLQPGAVVRVRFVEKNQPQVVDALKERALAVPPAELCRLSTLLAEAEPDARLWELLTAGPWSWQPVLAVLGWDPLRARCEMCGAAEPRFFGIAAQDFFCAACVSKIPQDEVLSIGELT